MEQILKTIQVQVSKVASLSNTLETVVETTKVALSLHEWPLWVKYCGMHGYKSVTVIDLFDASDNSMKSTGLVAKYQAEVDAVLKPQAKETTSNDDEIKILKAQNEALSKRLDTMAKNEEDKDKRKKLFIEATGLGLKPQKNIETDALEALIEAKKNENK